MGRCVLPLPFLELLVTIMNNGLTRNGERLIIRIGNGGKSRNHGQVYPF